MLVNLCIVLAGGSTRRRALDLDDSPYAFGCLVTPPTLNRSHHASASAKSYLYRHPTLSLVSTVGPSRAAA